MGVEAESGMKVYVEPRGGRAGTSPEPRRRRGPMTPVEYEYDDVFPAPASRPGLDPTPQVCRARSVGEDAGLWFYERTEGDGSPWSVTYVPTGQVRDGYPNQFQAREATASGLLLHELRGEAVTAAYNPDDVELRAVGQRWLGIHMRIACAPGTVTIDSGCRCGGLLVVAHSDGRLAHIDACESCYLPDLKAIAADCVDGGEHVVCGDPRSTLTPVQRRILEFECQWWLRPGAKEQAIRTTFGGMSPVRYYQLLNRLLAHPDALEVDAPTIRRLRRLRRSRKTT